VSVVGWQVWDCPWGECATLERATAAAQGGEWSTDQPGSWRIYLLGPSKRADGHAVGEGVSCLPYVDRVPGRKRIALQSDVNAVNRGGCGRLGWLRVVGFAMVTEGILQFLGRPEPCCLEDLFDSPIEAFQHPIGLRVPWRRGVRSYRRRSLIRLDREPSGLMNSWTTHKRSSADSKSVLRNSTTMAPCSGDSVVWSSCGWLNRSCTRSRFFQRRTVVSDTPGSSARYCPANLDMRTLSPPQPSLPNSYAL